MKPTKQDSDAPRMHAIEIERGIKKTVGIECVWHILLAQNSLGMTLYNLYYNADFFFAELEIIKSSNECTKRVSNEWCPKKNSINGSLQNVKFTKNICIFIQVIPQT